MTHQIRKATVADAIAVATNLRPEDRKEMEAMGQDPFQLVWGVLLCADSFAFTNYENQLAGVGGVLPDSEGNAYIWTICTPHINSMGITFFRAAHRRIDELVEPYNMVYALCDSRNKLHHRFLKYLGFKALRTVPTGPTNIPFYEVVKLCAHPLLQEQQSQL